MRAQLHGIESEAQVRRALDEIERLLHDAAEAGILLDPWVGELAEELRAVVPAIDAAGIAKVAKRMAAEPRASLAAQGRLAAGTLRALKP